MRPKRPIPENEKESIKEALQTCKGIESYRRVLCVWLRADLDMSAEDIAKAICLSAIAVHKIHRIYFERGIEALCISSRGGRWHANMQENEESEFLSGFLKQAEAAGVIVAGDIKAAYEEKIGRKVPKSTIYRMLDRHGWRKILPRARHPKSDPEIMEEFKKNSPQSSPKRSR